MRLVISPIVDTVTWHGASGIIVIPFQGLSDGGDPVTPDPFVATIRSAKHPGKVLVGEEMHRKRNRTRRTVAFRLRELDIDPAQDSDELTLDAYQILNTDIGILKFGDQLLEPYPVTLKKRGRPFDGNVDSSISTTFSPSDVEVYGTAPTGDFTLTKAYIAPTGSIDPTLGVRSNGDFSDQYGYWYTCFPTITPPSSGTLSMWIYFNTHIIPFGPLTFS